MRVWSGDEEGDESHQRGAQHRAEEKTDRKEEEGGRDWSEVTESQGVDLNNQTERDEK